MTYGEFCKHFEIETSPDAFVVWLYFSLYTRGTVTRPARAGGSDV